MLRNLKKAFSIHHFAFLSNPNSYPFVKHRVNMTLNNRANNLYYTITLSK